MLTTLLSSDCPIPQLKDIGQYVKSYWADKEIPFTFSMDSSVCQTATKSLPELFQTIAIKTMRSWETACSSAIQFIFHEVLATQGFGVRFACSNFEKFNNNHVGTTIETEVRAKARTFHQTIITNTSCVYLDCDHVHSLYQNPMYSSMDVDMYVQNALTHEVGHTLGFGHTHEGSLGKALLEHSQNSKNHQPCSSMAYNRIIPRPRTKELMPNPGETDKALCNMVYDPNNPHRNYIRRVLARDFERKDSELKHKLKEVQHKMKETQRKMKNAQRERELKDAKHKIQRKMKDTQRKIDRIERNIKRAQTNEIREQHAIKAGILLGAIDASTEYVCRNIFTYNAMTTNLIKASTTSLALALYSLHLDNVMLSSVFIILSIMPVLGFYQQWHQSNANSIEQNKRAKQLDWVRYILQIGLFITLTEDVDANAMQLLKEVTYMALPSMLSSKKLLALCINNNNAKNPRYQV